MKIFFSKIQPLPRRTASVKIDKLPLPRRDVLLKESAATAPPPRRDRHGGSGSAAMDIFAYSASFYNNFYVVRHVR
jgi:hypothetical protein